MCGIAGYYGLGADEALLDRLNQLQEHRGPDDSGIYMDGPAGLAHRRLAIIDVAHGDEPMTTPDGRFTLVYNGEVYNYLDLRAELVALGAAFRTDSDAEVVLQGFAQWGTAVFDRFNGMFAVAIWDRQEQRLTLARDHFGIKPLYICPVGPGQWLFSSEIKPILASGRYEKKPNERTIYRYLKFRIHEAGTETFFDGIERLLPGEMMTIDASGAQRSMYTRLREELLELATGNKPYTPAEAETYRRELVESIRLRLQSEVPVGTSLSGGLDSSAVAVVINSLLNEGEQTAAASVGAQQNTFSAVFPNSINDEERYVDDVLEICHGQVDSHKIRPTADEFKVDLADFVRTQEEPLISSGPYAQYQVMREACQHVTVLLDGQGADEMMAGYIPYYYVYLRQLRRENPRKALVELARSADVLGRLGRFKVQDRLKRRRSVEFSSLLNPDFAGRHTAETFNVERDNLKKRLVQDIFENSLPSLLRYEDRNTMRFSLEGRVPFLDKEVLKHIFSLSDEAIIHDGWNKRILRDATRRLLPDSINRRRNKIGFTTPEKEWFERLKNYFHSILRSDSFGSRPYFDQQAVVDAFEGWIRKDNDTSTMTFWRMINLELWLREFFDDKSVEEAPAEPVIKSDFTANVHKQIDLTLPDGSTLTRYPLRTEKVSADTDLDAFVSGRVQQFFDGADDQQLASLKGRDWYLFISEKIVAITQGRSYFIWDIKPGFWAKTLSKFVTRTPAGIGLGSPYTMQLAIGEAGLPRVLFSSAAGAVGKVIGKKGLFYELVGGDVRAIDGPTEYSVYPANVSAKLAPKDPDQVAERLSGAIRSVVPAEFEPTFKGVVVIDSNDIGRNILGHNTSQDPERLATMFADNPQGQGDEQTPMSVVVEPG